MMLTHQSTAKKLSLLCFAKQTIGPNYAQTITISVHKKVIDNLCKGFVLGSIDQMPVIVSFNIFYLFVDL
jgi:hypothetical protein